MPRGYRFSHAALTFGFAAICPLLQAAEPVSALWSDFLEARRNDTTPILPDFSYAGYHYCEQAIPDVAGPIFDVTDYGAVADDGISDEVGIQATIDAAEAAGGGVVFFPAGRFDLSVTEELRNTVIFVNSSDIVLRGSGSGDNGTELFQQLSLVESANGERWKIQIRPEITNPPSAKITDITADTVRESFSVTVTDASSFAVGDLVLVHMPENSDKSVEDWYCQPHVTKNYWAGHIWFLEYHEVVAVEGNQLVFKEPIRMDIRSQDGWEVWNYPSEHLREVGVEDIRFRGNWHETSYDHSADNPDFDLVFFRHVIDGWVRRCEFHDTVDTLKFERSARISLLNTDYYGVKGHKAMASETCWNILMAGGRSYAPHYHVPSYDDSTTGFVLWRFDYSGSSYDPHGEWNISNLNDASRGHMIDGRMGTGSDDLPNHLRQLVFWNFEHTGTQSSFDWWRGWYDNHQSVVMPIIVGLHGNEISFQADEVAYDEHHGQQVQPESLFEAQLELRLGSLPDWLVAMGGGNNRNLDLEARAKSHEEIMLRWRDFAAADWYLLQRKQSDIDNQVMVVPLNADSDNYRDRSLDPDQTYHYGITAGTTE